MGRKTIFELEATLKDGRAIERAAQEQLQELASAMTRADCDEHRNGLRGVSWLAGTAAASDGR